MQVLPVIMALAISFGSSAVCPSPIAVASEVSVEVSLKEPTNFTYWQVQNYIDEQQRAATEEKKRLAEERRKKQETQEKANKDILYRIALAEAGGDEKQAIKNIVYVILNRVNDDWYPDTVEEVVFQKFNGQYQFSPIADKRYWEVKVTDFVRDAVDKAYSDYEDSDKAEGAIFFKATYCDADWSNYEFLFSDGKHDYYKR